jgi:hypothetical protein
MNELYSIRLSVCFALKGPYRRALVGSLVYFYLGDTCDMFIYPSFFLTCVSSDLIAFGSSSGKAV